MSNTLTDEETRLLNSGVQRAMDIEKLHSEGREVEKKLRSLIGKRCKKGDTEYEIMDIRYGWNGYTIAYGYRIVKGGKRGTRSRWEIGRIIASDFT